MSVQSIDRTRRGRLLVLLVYGSLLGQVIEYSVATAAHWPRAVNTFQFAAIAVELCTAIALARLTREVAGPGRDDRDERERAVHDRAGRVAFIILGSAVALLAGGYLLGHDTVGWFPAVTPIVLSFAAFCGWMLVWTLPSAVIAWTQPPPAGESD
jgi:hypothetical protein